MTEVNPSTRMALRTRPNEVSFLHQDWRDLLFLHWKYDPNEIQKTLPQGLYVDTFKGDAYLSVVPFFIVNFTIAKICPFPTFSNLIEVNLRTYVYDENGTPGVWFYSLDINSFLAAKGGFYAFGLPYQNANLKKQDSENAIIIEGNRSSQPNIKMKFSYRKEFQDCCFAKEDTLEFFLLERYVLFTYFRHRLYQGQVYHTPYPFQKAKVMEYQFNLEKEHSFDLSGPASCCHYSPGVNVDIFNLKKC